MYIQSRRKRTPTSVKFQTTNNMAPTNMDLALAQVQGKLNKIIGKDMTNIIMRDVEEEEYQDRRDEWLLDLEIGAHANHYREFIDLAYSTNYTGCEKFEDLAVKMEYEPEIKYINADYGRIEMKIWSGPEVYKQAITYMVENGNTSYSGYLRMADDYYKGKIDCHLATAFPPEDSVEMISIRNCKPESDSDSDSN